MKIIGKKDNTRIRIISKRLILLTSEAEIPIDYIFTEKNKIKPMRISHPLQKNNKLESLLCTLIKFYKIK